MSDESEFHVSIAQHGHAQLLRDMIWAASQVDVEKGYPPAFLSPPDEKVADTIAAQQMRIITLHGGIAGCFSVEPNDELLWGVSSSADAALYLHCLTIASELQGKGLGRSAVEYVERTAIESGMKLVRLDVPVERDITRNWYKGMHYVERGVVQPASYRRPAMLYEKCVT
jgi:ribosomal protein S18 acetylase RimI-like enzyme